jgi:hypothetical protein
MDTYTVRQLIEALQSLVAVDASSANMEIMFRDEDKFHHAVGKPRRNHPCENDGGEPDINRNKIIIEI